MRYAQHIGCCLLSFALSACGGEILGVGSLLMQGLQMASGTSPAPSGAKNSPPFTRTNNADEPGFIEHSKKLAEDFILQTGGDVETALKTLDGTSKETLDYISAMLRRQGAARNR